jgi:tight adherence protein C
VDLLFLALLDTHAIIPIALFGAFAAAAWFILDWLSYRKPRAEERLDYLRDPRAARGERESKRTGETMARVLEKASPALAKPLQPKTAKEAGKIRQKLDFAGFRSEAAPGIYLSCKIIGLFVGLVVGGGTAVFFDGLSQSSLMKTGAAVIVMFYLPDILVKYLTMRRQQAIFLGLPDALDLMVVCVEAGLGLDQALRRVAEEMKKAHRIVAEEFAICNFHLQMGKERKVVLHELGARNGVDDLRSLASVIIQAEKFGSSVGTALRVQSDSMRTRRRQIAEEKAAKTAVQLIFPLVLFIFPGIFVVLVGPAAITMVREMFPVMNGG